MIIWRISNYANLDGEGGMYASGRWHTAERRIVYSSDHPASALLEMLVHLDPVAKPKFYRLLKVEAPEELSIQKHPPLPANWRDESELTRKIGNQWLDQQQAAILAVPSAIVPDAVNFLINPAHRDAESLKILAAVHVPLDQRLK